MTTPAVRYYTFESKADALGFAETLWDQDNLGVYVTEGETAWLVMVKEYKPEESKPNA